MIPTLISFMQTRKNYKEESAQSHTVSKGLDEHPGMYIGNCSCSLSVITEVLMKEELCNTEFALKWCIALISSSVYNGKNIEVLISSFLSNQLSQQEKLGDE